MDPSEFSNKGNLTSAVLVQRRDGGYYLHVPISDPAPEPIDPDAVEAFTAAAAWSMRARTVMPRLVTAAMSRSIVSFGPWLLTQAVNPSGVMARTP